MTLQSELFNAILSMDAYNRGYDASIALPSTTDGSVYIGSAKIIDDFGDASAQSIGFYALAYDYNGETIIAFRGTDYPYTNPKTVSVAGQDIPADIYHGWSLGGGFTASEQGQMAVDFYQSVVGTK